AASGGGAALAGRHGGGGLSLWPCAVSAGALWPGLSRATGAAAPAHWSAGGGGVWRGGRGQGSGTGGALCAGAGLPACRAVSAAGGGECYPAVESPRGAHAPDPGPRAPPLAIRHSHTHGARAAVARSAGGGP